MIRLGFTVSHYLRLGGWVGFINQTHTHTHTTKQKTRASSHTQPCPNKKRKQIPTISFQLKDLLTKRADATPSILMTSDWARNLFLGPGPLKWARAETGRLGVWNVIGKKFPEVTRVNRPYLNPASLKQRLLVFQKEMMMGITRNPLWIFKISIVNRVSKTDSGELLKSKVLHQKIILW